MRRSLINNRVRGSFLRIGWGGMDLDEKLSSCPYPHSEDTGDFIQFPLERIPGSFMLAEVALYRDTGHEL
jgi:hypothetical protein